MEPGRDDTSYKLLSKGAARHARSVLGRSLFVCPCLGIRLRDTKNCSLNLAAASGSSRERGSRSEQGGWRGQAIAYLRIVSNRVALHRLEGSARLKQAILRLACRHPFSSVERVTFGRLMPSSRQNCASPRLSLAGAKGFCCKEEIRRTDAPSAAHAFRKSFFLPTKQEETGGFIG